MGEQLEREKSASPNNRKVRLWTPKRTNTIVKNYPVRTTPLKVGDGI